MCGSGMLNMEGRGACDPNKFQILFPATSGSSCVQALRPFPTSPSLPFPKDCSLSLPGLPGQPPPPGVRGKSVCHCVCVTLGVFSEGGDSVPTPFHWSCSTSQAPPTNPRVLTAPKGDLFLAPSWCPVWPWKGVLEQVAHPHPSFLCSPPFSPPYNSRSRPGVEWGGLGEGARIRGMD